MPLKIIRDDITKLKVDAICNAANNTLLGGGGVDGAIHKAAGPKLLDECRTLGGCDIGEAKITKGYNLKAKYIIHTVGPIWHGGDYQEEELLRACYKKSLVLGEQYKIESIAFPLISSGIYGYPKDQVLRVAIDEISKFLISSDMLVYIVVFDKASFVISQKLFTDVSEYINDEYVDEEEVCFSRSFYKEEILSTLNMFNNDVDIVLDLDETFTHMLLRKIDELNIKDSQCYKRANIDRKLFSKIRSDLNYHPSKQTAVAFAIALKLDLNETNELLRKAGFVLSHSNKFDLIIEYFINKNCYDINEINEVLFAFDQKLLGY